MSTKLDPDLDLNLDLDLKTKMDVAFLDDAHPRDPKP